MSIDIVKIDWNDDLMVSSITDLLNESFNTKNNPMFTSELLRWKHRDNPFGESISYAAYDKSFGLVGLRTFLKWRFVNKDGLHSAFQPVDTATSPKARGKGIFSKLTQRALLDTDSEIIFNTPNENSFPGYIKMGWNYNGNIRFGVIPRLVPYSKKIIHGSKVNKNTFSDHVFSTSQACSKNLRTDKSNDFLMWRFISIPNIEYKIFKVNDDLAFIYKVKQRSSFRELMICDFFGKQDSSRLDFCLKLQKLLFSEKCHYAVVCYKDKPSGLSTLFYNVPFKKMKFVTKSNYEFVFTLTDIEVF